MASTMDVSLVLRLVDEASGPAKRAAENLQKIEKQTRSLGDRARRMGDGMASLGTRLTAGVTLPALGAVKVAADFETAMLEWKKAADELSTPKVFEESRQKIKQMATQLPLTQAELANLGAAASRAGVDFKTVPRFIELAAKTADAFNISVEDAGGRLANIKESAKIGVEGLNVLIGQMDLLENSMNVKGSQLTYLMDEIGGVGREAGFTNQQIIAMGSTMIASGTQAEKAGRTIRRMTDVLTQGAGMEKPAKDLLESFGLNPEEFAKAVNEDAVGALNTLRLKILELPEYKRLGALNTLFDSFGATGVSKLFSNWDTFNKAMETTNDKVAAQTQLDRSFSIVMEGLTPKLKLARNQLINIADTLARYWFPTIKKALSATSEWLGKLNETPTLMHKVAAAAGALAVAGPGLWLAGTALKGVAGGLRAVSAASVFLLANPLGLTLAAIGAAGYLIYKNWDKVAPAWKKVTEEAGKLGKALTPIGTAINEITQAITGKTVGSVFADLGEGYVKTVAGGLETIAEALRTIRNIIKDPLDLGSWLDASKGLAEGALNTIAPGLLPALKGADDFLGGYSNQSDKSRSGPMISGRRPGRNLPKPAAHLPPSVPPKPRVPALMRRSGAPLMARDQRLDDVRRQLNELIGSDLPAAIAANGQVSGQKLPGGMSIESTGPTVHVNQAPPIVNNNVTVNVANSTEAPEATARAVSEVLEREVRAGMYDGGHE